MKYDRSISLLGILRSSLLIPEQVMIIIIIRILEHHGQVLTFNMEIVGYTLNLRPSEQTGLLNLKLFLPRLHLK